MKRDRADRGKDKWERCSWDEAIAIIKKNYDEVKENYGVESMVAFMGTGRQGNIGATGAHRVLGSPNGCYPPVSYTHLDVYKRQRPGCRGHMRRRRSRRT